MHGPEDYTRPGCQNTFSRSAIFITPVTYGQKILRCAYTKKNCTWRLRQGT